jgi:hypothetical protein
MLRVGAFSILAALLPIAQAQPGEVDAAFE